MSVKPVDSDLLEIQKIIGNIKSDPKMRERYMGIYGVILVLYVLLRQTISKASDIKVHLHSKCITSIPKIKILKEKKLLINQPLRSKGQLKDWAQVLLHLHWLLQLLQHLFLQQVLLLVKVSLSQPVT